MNRMSFRVPDLSRGRDLHRIPVVPRDDLAPAAGLALAMVGGVMLWAGIAVLAWNFWGRS